MFRYQFFISRVFLMLFFKIMTVFFLGSTTLAGSPSLMVVDATRDHVVWLQDLDADGRYDGPNEAEVFYDDSSIGPNLSVPSALIARSDDLLLLDGGTIDSLISLKDVDRDGFATGDDEVRVIYDDAAAGPDLAVPSSMVIDSSGVIYIGDRSTTKRHVLRLQDLDGDGDMDQLEEATIWLQISGNPQLADFTPSAVCLNENGSLLVGDGASGLIYACQDLNNDGIVQGTSEVKLWFTNPTSYGISTVDALSSPDGENFFLADEETGTILHLKDIDQDGIINTTGEVLPFCDGTNSESLLMAPMVLFPSPTGGLFVGDPGQDSLLLVTDLDHDGTANTNGEQQFVFDDQGALLPSIRGITNVPGPLDITIDSIEPQLVDRAGGTPLQIHGNGWLTGNEVTLRIEGIDVPAIAPLAGMITAVIPALPSGPHDLMIIIENQQYFAPMAFHSTTYFQRGDADRDQRIQIADAITLLMWMFIPGSAEIPCLDAADLNDDGRVELLDAVHLLNWLFASGSPPALPHPEPGPDPNQQGPGCLE